MRMKLKSLVDTESYVLVTKRNRKTQYCTPLRCLAGVLEFLLAFENRFVRPLT